MQALRLPKGGLGVKAAGTGRDGDGRGVARPPCRGPWPRANPWRPRGGSDWAERRVSFDAVKVAGNQIGRHTRDLPLRRVCRAARVLQDSRDISECLRPCWATPASPKPAARSRRQLRGERDEPRARGTPVSGSVRGKPGPAKDRPEAATRVSRGGAFKGRDGQPGGRLSSAPLA